MKAVQVASVETPVVTSSVVEVVPPAAPPTPVLSWDPFPCPQGWSMAWDDEGLTHELIRRQNGHPHEH